MTLKFLSRQVPQLYLFVDTEFLKTCRKHSQPWRGDMRGLGWVRDVLILPEMNDLNADPLE